MGFEAKEATVIALSVQVPEGEVHPVVLNGFELAVWRDSTGQVHLWEDRCPHRGMRLSFGFVRENRLTCLYQGWQYGTDGACKRIPAHPDLEPPRTLCTNSFDLAERCGMIVQNGTPEPGNWHAVRTVFVPRAMGDLSLPNVSETPWREEGSISFGTADGHQLALAMQPVNACETAIHLITTDPDPDARLSLARALVSYRTSFKQEIA